MADLSPQAQAVLDAANSAYDDAATVAQGTAAALCAAALRLRDVRWDGCIEPDAEIQIGLNWACDAILVLADELENNG